MKGLAGRASVLAIGLVIGAILIVGTGATPQHAAASAQGKAAIDFQSFLIGLLVGLLCAGLTRVAWLELPRRVVTWIVENERNMYRLGLAAVFVAILVFY